MKTYTDKDVLRELKLIIPKYRTRKRSYIDKRNYLISILHYKFNYTEEKISNIFQLTADPIERSSVCHAKKQPGTFSKYDEDTFIKNTEGLVKKFPFELIEEEEKGLDKNLTIPLAFKQHKRLSKYCKKHNMRLNQAIRKLLDVSLQIDETNYQVKLVNGKNERFIY